MKIAVFGATGRTGIPLVKQALDAGHIVVALVRNPAKMPLQHSNLHLIQGDVSDAASVDRTIQPDVDAVISVLAPAKGAAPDMLPRAVDHILAAMDRHGLRRLIWMSGAGVPMPQDQPGLFDHVIRFLLKTLSPDVLKQSEIAVRKVEASQMDWTVVRAPMLLDGEETGKLRVGWVGVGTGPRLVRADAARFMIEELDSASYHGQAPVLSN